MPLKPIISTCLFVKWGLYFIGPINSPSSTSHAFILTETNYFTKWYKFVPLINANDDSVITFFEENLLLKFGVLVHIATDNGLAFISHKFATLYKKIYHK